MANYKLSEKQYLKYFGGYSKMEVTIRDITKIILLSIFIFIIIGVLIYFKQYISSILLVIIYLFFAFFSRLISILSAKKYYRNNKFLQERIEIIFSKDTINVKFKNNTLNFFVYDIYCIKRRSDVYYIGHNLGVKLFIPVNSLTNEEIKHIDNYIKVLNKKK